MHALPKFGEKKRFWTKNFVAWKHSLIGFCYWALGYLADTVKILETDASRKLTDTYMHVEDCFCSFVSAIGIGLRARASCGQSSNSWRVSGNALSGPQKEKSP